MHGVMSSTRPGAVASETEAQMRELLRKARKRIERYETERDEKIAVVGVAARFPGAADLAAFWPLLESRSSGLRPVDRDDLEAAGVPPAVLDDDDYVPVWGGPPEADGFDAGFFGYAPREAELMDPQQRMFLECAWHALEDAGYGADQLAALVGVYAGASLSGHLVRAAGRADPFRVGLANIGGMVAARASFHLNLTGPGVGVQTTCSTSLVAVHQAIQGLRRRDCDMALAGAVAVNQPRPEGYRYLEEGIAAPDGRCRPFDADAKGTVFTNGVGVVVLKRLSDAEADGDTIHGVLLGSAVNNDGAGKISLTAPSVSGQAAVLGAALAAAGIDGGGVDYVEAHGTGTLLGDPIEVAALNRSYGPGLAAAGRRCGLGSVKGNLGHLDAAAGMASLVKMLLAFRHERLPGVAHFARPNPKAAFGAFDVVGATRTWPRDPARPRRAGVSSFGIGGTNAHLIVEEPPAVAPREAEGEKPQLLTLSARTPAALARLREDLAHALAAPDAPDLADAAFTLQAGRRAFEERQAVVAATAAEAVAALRRGDAPVVRSLAGTPTVAFVFSGQGSQRPGMARDLYAADAAFRAALDACLDLAPADLELRTLLLDPDDPGAGRIHETRFTQPALFAFEYALARLWTARGLQPAAMLGHSIGEYVAATLAGVFDLPDAMRVVSARGALMQACPPGAMLAVMMSEGEAAGCLPEAVEIAAANGPNSTVLAGPSAAIDSLADRFDRSGIGCRRLVTSHAFHTAAMEPALEGFRDVLAGVALRAPEAAILSNVTGDWLTDAEAVDPDYWVRQLRRPVRYRDGVARLAEMHCPLLLEVGPGAGLARLARQQLPPEGRSVASLPDAGATDGGREILKATGALWAAGAALDWPTLHPRPRRRVSLPGYPFERQSYWLPPASDPAEARDAEDAADWFYQPEWRRLPAIASPSPARLLVLDDAAAKVALGGLPPGAVAATSTPGGPFAATAHGYALDPADPDQLRALISALAAEAPLDGILCASGLGESAGDRPGPLFEAALALGRALAASDLKPRITLLGAGMQEVTGREALDPGAAMALGLAAALPHELPGVECRTIDLDPAELGGPVPGLAEAVATPWDGARSLAVRGGYVWRGDHVPTRMKARNPVPALAKDGPCLVVGDLAEGLGLAFARAVRRELDAPLILAGRGLPDPAEWDAWLAAHAPQDPTSRLISALAGLGEVGRDIVVLSGDAGDAGWLERALAEAEARLGPVAGVFHTAAMGDAWHCPLDETTFEAAGRRAGAKLRTVAALREVLSRRAPAFCLLQSSLSVVVGGHGFATYAAANAGLEAAAALANRDGGTAWQVVQWDVAETGSLGEAARDLSSVRILTQDEVWQASLAVLSHPRAGRVAATQARLDRRREAQAPAQPKTGAQRRPSSTPYVAPRDDYETAVAAVMGDMLGVPEVGADDNFFELGGHSLLAIQIINRLRREFDVELPVRALLYEAPTVAGIGGVIRAAREAAGREADQLGRLLDEMEMTQK